jgi:hypothetical protein
MYLSGELIGMPMKTLWTTFVLRHAILIAISPGILR